MQLAGKTIVYVGGYGGIGYATCAQLLRKGIKCLVILDVRENKEHEQQLRQINPQTSLIFMELNLLNGRAVIEQTLHNVKAIVGDIDLLINGSGIVNDRNPQLTVNINLLGLIETTLAAVPLMSKAHGARGGMILNIASVLGLEPGAFLAVYTATKHGVVGFTRACGDEHYYAHTGIAHVAICPGATSTPILNSFVAVDTFEFSRPLSEHIITAKSQTPEECACNIVECIERATNGSIWLSDLGALQPVTMHKYWQYTF